MAPTTGLAAKDDKTGNKEVFGPAAIEQESKRDKGKPTDKPAALWNTTLSFHGYFKTDAIHSRFSAGDPGERSVGRDFYIPATVPVGPDDDFSGIDLHVKQSRFRFETTTSYYDNEPIRGRFELDFMLSTGGDERVTNSFNPRLRHAFFTFKNVLIGQTYTNFMDVATYPESLNFTGPSESIILVRQPQFRVSFAGLQFSAENPETTVTPNGGGGRIVTGDSDMPDLTVSSTFNLRKTRLSLGLLARQLRLDDGQNIHGKAWGYGFNFTGKLPIYRHDLKFLVAAGEGIGRYIGLNTTNDSVVTSGGDLEAIPLVSAYLNYRHRWSAFWRTNLIAGVLEIDNDTELTGPGVTRSVKSLIGNVIWQWRPEVSFGAEILHAERETEGGADGTLNRLQFSGKFAF